MPVEVDTHCLSLVEFESGVIGEMMVSYDVWDSETPRFEIYGTEGTLCIPDPDPGRWRQYLPGSGLVPNARGRALDDATSPKGAGRLGALPRTPTESTTTHAASGLPI